MKAAAQPSVLLPGILKLQCSQFAGYKRVLREEELVSVCPALLRDSRVNYPSGFRFIHQLLVYRGSVSQLQAWVTLHPQESLNVWSAKLRHHWHLYINRASSLIYDCEYEMWVWWSYPPSRLIFQNLFGEVLRANYVPCTFVQDPTLPSHLSCGLTVASIHQWGSWDLERVKNSSWVT